MCDQVDWRSLFHILDAKQLVIEVLWYVDCKHWVMQ